MRITAISDLHGHFPKLPGGDLLIVAGDLCSIDSEINYLRAYEWMVDQPYSKVIFIGGNHDNRLEKVDMAFYSPKGKVEYLCDSGTAFQVLKEETHDCGPHGCANWHKEEVDLRNSKKRPLKIWGSPWTATFKGINPHCMAFTMPYDCDNDDWLAEKWDLIPEGIDILVTHSPPYGILDYVDRPFKMGEHTGSKSLLKALERIKPKLHIFGHIHEGYGQYRPVLEPVGLPGYPIFINASHVNELYEPVNEPITLEL